MREYQFRKAFSATHEEFLDNPVKNTQWLLAIEGAHTEVEVDLAKRESAKARK